MEIELKQYIDEKFESLEDRLLNAIEGKDSLITLTPTQAAKELQCSKSKIYDLIQAGKLVATKVSEKKTLINKKSIEKLKRSA